MEVMNRGVRQSQPGDPLESDSVPQAAKVNRVPGSSLGPKGLRVAQVGLLACVAILIVAAAILMATSDNNKAKIAAAVSESRFVDTSKMQAVFLNNGQVYFGKIGDLTKDYLSLSEIYYLQIEQQVQPGKENQASPTLRKLGCELHRPSDTMVINRSQIVFWENLKDDSSEQTVPGAVKKYAEANKGEQKCETAPANSSTPATRP